MCWTLQGVLAAVWQPEVQKAVPTPLPAWKLCTAAVCWVLRQTLRRPKLQSASYRDTIRLSHRRPVAYNRHWSLFFVFTHIVISTVAVTASAAAIAIVTIVVSATIATSVAALTIAVTVLVLS